MLYLSVLNGGDARAVLGISRGLDRGVNDSNIEWTEGGLDGDGSDGRVGEIVFFEVAPSNSTGCQYSFRVQSVLNLIPVRCLGIASVGSCPCI